MKALFVGSNGVRAGWRVLAFFAIAIVLLFGLQLLVVPFAAQLLHLDGGTLNAPAFVLAEVVESIVVLVATGALARFERRRIDAFGLPVRRAFGGRFWEGVALGVASAGLVALVMIALGGMVVGGIALHGGELVADALLWALVMLLVGLNEEYLFRGYALQTLARGIGFWPAAVLLSLFFGVAHLTKPHENIFDIANIVLLGLLLCFTVSRTGSLWLAVGFHFAFDFMQFFVIGTRNGGAQPVGHLLQVTFPGPAWLTGGALGTEASFLMLPAIALLAFYVSLRYPQTVALET